MSGDRARPGKATATAAPLRRLLATRRRVNDLISERLGEGGPGDPVAFFCECGEDGCFRPVWLTPVEYEQRRSRPGWRALAPGHGEAG